MIKLKPVVENRTQEEIIFRKIKRYYDDLLFNFIDLVIKDRYENDKQDANGNWHDEDGKFTSHKIKISGKELGEYSSLKELRKKAEHFYHENLQGTTVEREGLGVVRFSKKGRDETTSKGAQEDKLKLIVAIKDIILWGKIGEEEPIYKPRTDGIISFISITSKVDIDGKTKNVGVFIGKDNKGHLYYDMFIQKHPSVWRHNPKSGERKENNSFSDTNITDFELNVKIIPTEKEFIRLENDNSIEWYIRKGYITYKDGVFTSVRKIPNKIAKELEKLGAKWSKLKKGYVLSPKKLPPTIMQAIAEVKIFNNEKLKKINDYLLGLNDTLDFIQIDFTNEVVKIGTDLENQFAASMKKINVIPAKITEFQKLEIAKNYTKNLNYYIQKWSKQEIVKLRRDLEPFVMSGYRAESLEELIRKHKNISARKAKFLARQETKLLVAEYRKNRFKEHGVTQYIWKAVMDERTRELHRELNGRIFSWDSPPIIDARTGETGSPAQAFGCRCVAIPVVEW